MKTTSILSAAALFWGMAGTAGAQECPGEEFERHSMTASCEAGVMVYRGYTGFGGRHISFSDKPARQEEGKAGRNAAAKVHRGRVPYYLRVERFDTPHRQKRARWAWKDPAPEARMVRVAQ